MKDPVYIIGHKNPDADSICSAIAYSDFKKAIGFDNYIPARCGNSNARINSILDYFNVSLPVFVGDVTPRLHDIMVPADKIQKISASTTCAEALELIDKYDIRALPVVNEKDEPEGVITFFQLGEYFIPQPSKPDKMRRVHTSIEAIVRSLGADTFFLINEEKSEDLYVRIGAMATESFGDFSHREGTPEQSIVVVGNRTGIQERSIDLNVRLLVVTGKQDIQPHIIEKAKENNVSLIKSPFDVASTAWIIRSATPVEPLVARDLITFNPEEKLSNVRRRIANNTFSLYHVIDEENKLAGIFSKSDILKPVKTQLILVDHNEMSQAVNGAEEVKILEIIDHHRLGNPNTHQPIRFINEPVGSTSTIVANMFRSHNLTPSKATAGLMMGGLISDTLNLNSPTTTDVDREILPWLGEIAGISPDDLSQIIFNSGSVILNASSAKVIETDCKIYNEGESNFSISQVEELGFTNFWNHQEDLTLALEEYRKKEGLLFSLLFVTDVNTQNSLLVIQGDHDIIHHIGYPQVDNHPIFELDSIVSRKKQLVPYVTSLLTDAMPS